MPTLAQLTSRLRQELKIDPNGRIWSDAFLQQRINEGVSRLQSDGNYNWHFNDAIATFPSVAGQASYALPVDFVRVEAGSVLFGGKPLAAIDFRERTNNPNLANQGAVTAYSLRGADIFLVLVPAEIETVTLGYRKKMAKMIDAADDSGLPEEFANAVTKWAAYLAWSTIRNGEQKAISTAQDYQELVKDLFTQFLGRRDENNFNMSYEIE